MEFIIGLIVIGVLCLILGVQLDVIITAICILIFLVPASMTLLFTVCLLLLITAKRRPAAFSKIEKSGKSAFATAFYVVDGEEYPCIFPAESTRLTRLYRRDKTYHVMYSRRLKRVFDRFALTTCILGFIASGFMTAAFLLLFSYF